MEDADRRLLLTGAGFAGLAALDPDQLATVVEAVRAALGPPPPAMDPANVDQALAAVRAAHPEVDAMLKELEAAM